MSGDAREREMERRLERIERVLGALFKVVEEILREMPPRTYPKTRGISVEKK